MSRVVVVLPVLNDNLHELAHAVKPAYQHSLHFGRGSKAYKLAASLPGLDDSSLNALASR